MATTLATAAARSVPVYTVPLGPRIRPPRLLPGTKAENSNPQPAEVPPENKVWSYGKWRHPESRAARKTQQVLSGRAEKALRHITHGMNIYAYRHLRTNQVVYSLTKVMKNTQIMAQLLFHGKQTKPAALRRDVWTPYFSIHFARTAAGAEAGLWTYRVLRELSYKRQLSPKREDLITTEEDIKKVEARYNPLNLQDAKDKHKLRNMPIKGQLLPLKMRAQKLMDQKASSVADVAFVLGLWHKETGTRSPEEWLAVIEEARIEKHKRRTQRARTRINRIKRLEASKDEELQDRSSLIEHKAGRVGVDKHTAARIAIEHSGAIRETTMRRNNYVDGLQETDSARESSADRTKTLATIADKWTEQESGLREQFRLEWRRRLGNVKPLPPFPEQKFQTVLKAKKAEFLESHKADLDEERDESRIVHVVWSDMRDGHYAEQWPSNVFHSDLEPMAVVKQRHEFVQSPAAITEDGEQVALRKGSRLLQHSTTPHVFGRATESGWYQSPEDIAKSESKRQLETREAHGANRREDAIVKLIELRSATLDGQPVGTDHAARKERERQAELLHDLEARYPYYTTELDHLDYYTSKLGEQFELEQKIEESPPGEGRTRLIHERREVVSELSQYYEPFYFGFAALELRRLDLARHDRDQRKSNGQSLQDSETGSSHERSLTSASKDFSDQLQHATREALNKKVDLILARHAEDLRSSNDPSWQEAQTTSRSVGSLSEEDQRETKLPDDVVVVNESPGVWSRMKRMLRMG